MKKPFSCNKPFSITRKALVVPVFSAFPMRGKCQVDLRRTDLLGCGKGFEPEENGLTLT
jgi:hypothetical protein